MGAILFLVLALGLAAGVYALSNSTTPGGTLNVQQISSYASRAGFSGSALVTATAIALAESGGDPTAYNPETAAGNPAGQGSVGLWQININAHPEFAGQNLNDPQTNANAAYAVYLKAGYSFQPWATYTGGQYVSFLNDASGGVQG